MRALITGVTGFVGRHLLQHLREAGDEVSGIGRKPGGTDLEADHVFHIELANRAAVEDIVRQTQPEAIYHLAAQSSPAASLADPWATICNNLQAQFNLMEALRSVGIGPRVLI